MKEKTQRATPTLREECRLHDISRLLLRRHVGRRLSRIDVKVVIPRGPVLHDINPRRKVGVCHVGGEVVHEVDKGTGELFTGLPGVQLSSYSFPCPPPFSQVVTHESPVDQHTSRLDGVSGEINLPDHEGDKEYTTDNEHGNQGSWWRHAGVNIDVELGRGYRDARSLTIFPSIGCSCVECEWQKDKGKGCGKQAETKSVDD